MTNADKFKSIFGLYATELWAKPEKDFLEWLNADVELFGISEQLNDTISRRAAINAICEDGVQLERHAQYSMTMVERKQRDVDILEALPPAQPEIIHCKDCKNSEHWYRNRGRCFLWSEDGVSVFEDGFCNYAERRNDD